MDWTRQPKGFTFNGRWAGRIKTYRFNCPVRYNVSGSTETKFAVDRSFVSCIPLVSLILFEAKEQAYPAWIGKSDKYLYTHMKFYKILYFKKILFPVPVFLEYRTHLQPIQSFHSPPHHLDPCQI